MQRRRGSSKLWPDKAASISLLILHHGMMYSQLVHDEPLTAIEARRLICEILSNGTVTYSQPHALERLLKHRMTMLDCEYVLRGGVVDESE